MRWTIDQQVDLTEPNKIDTKIAARLFVGDDRAHSWKVNVMDSGNPADLQGATVEAYVNRPDGVTVNVGGAVSENVAAAVFPREAYEVPGVIHANMKIVGQSGEVITVASARMLVEQGPYSEFIDPQKNLEVLAIAMNLMYTEFDARIRDLESKNGAVTLK